MEGVRVATVLLMLSLVAAACCLSAAAADVDTIRLPSQGNSCCHDYSISLL